MPRALTTRFIQNAEAGNHCDSACRGLSLVVDESAIAAGNIATSYTGSGV